MRKILCTAIAFLILVSASAFGVSAGWDGYSGEEKDTPFLDTSKITTILDTGNVPIVQGIKGVSSNSIYWSHDSATPQMTILKNGLYDLSAYDGMWMWIYSAQKTNSVFAFVCNKKSGGYYMLNQKIDWVGWKKFNFDFSAFSQMGAVTKEGWDDITAITLYAHGWSMTPDPEAVLYLNSMFFSKPAGESNAALSFNQQKLDSILKKSVCFYSGNSQFLQNGEIQSDSSGRKAIEKNGVCYVPLEIFNAALNTDITVTNGKAFAGNQQVELPILEQDSQIYVPAESCGMALGKNTIAYRGLVMLSNDKLLNEIQGNESMLDKTARMVTANHTDYAKMTQTDINQILDNWTEYLVSANSDAEDEFVLAKRKQIEKDALAYYSGMNKTADAPILWGNSPVTTTSAMGQQYFYLRLLAVAWATPGISLYHNEQLKQDILFGIEWGYQHLYGEAEMANKGWRDTSAYNWFEWQITVPRELTKTLLILRDFVPQEQMNRYLKTVDYFTDEKFGILINSTAHGANIADTAYSLMLSKLLQNDPEYAAKALNLIVRDLGYMDTYKGDGQHKDGSYRFHYYYAMNGTYGLSFMTAAIPIISIMAGTKFAVTDYNLDLYTEWVFRAYETSVYDGRLMSVFQGRHPGYEMSTGTSVYANLIELTEAIREKDRMHLCSVIKYFAQNGYLSASSLTIHQYNILSKILADENIKARENYTFFNMFSNTDKAIWQNNEYAFALSMCSNRTSGWESINGENKSGWYMSDGMLYLYNKDDINTYESNFWKYVNYYRLPGTTVDTQEQVAESIQDQRVYKSGQDFVGGAGLNDRYGTCAMILESFHNETASDYRSDYGNALPVHQNDLMAKKAYFIFDNELVALGSDINSTMNYDVETILDNRLSTQTINNNPEYVESYKIQSVTASDEPQAENAAVNVIDGDYATRWSAENEQYLIADLGEEKTVGMVGIAIFNGTNRINKYDISLSADGTNWQQIYSGASGGKTEAMEVYDGKGIRARYIKYDFHGNNSGSWNSVTEIAAYPPRADGLVALPEPMFMPAEKLIIDQKEVEPSYEVQTIDQCKWAHLENGAGYCFLTPAKVSTRKTNALSCFTELWIEHGKNPVKAGYAYAILPAKTVEETAAYAENPDVEILSNTDKLQAVYEKNTKVTGMVFYEAGNCGTVKVDAPCIITMQETDGKIELSLADPTQAVRKIGLDFGAEGYRFDASQSDILASCKDGTVFFSTAGQQGAAIHVTFTKK